MPPISRGPFKRIQAPNTPVRDVWEHKATAAVGGAVAIEALASHDSKFFILGDDKLYNP